MLSYRQAFPRAYAAAQPDRPNPFPNHYLVTRDEVRTLLAKHGWTIRKPPLREATREEIQNPAIRTYQLVTHTDAAPRDMVGLGCRFTFGRTYCFGEETPEIETTKGEEVKPTAPWAKHRLATLTTAKKAKPTHRITCEVIKKQGQITTVQTHDVEGDVAAYALGTRLSAISEATHNFGWVDMPTLLGGDDVLGFDTTTTEDAFWCDGHSPARVLVRPV